MEKIKPTVGYVSAWQAVNEANKPKMGYSSLTAFKQERFSNNIEAVYCTRRRGPLAQLLHNFMWAVSPGYRDKKLENRLALLNMIEDEIRTSSGTQAKYSRQGLKSHRGEPEQGGPGKKEPVRTLEDRPSEARRGVWEEGHPPLDLSKDVSKALKNAERNVGNRQAFLDSLHRIFITAAAEMAPDNEIDHNAGGFLNESNMGEIANQGPGQQKSGNKPEDIREAMLEEASAGKMKKELDVAIRNEHWKSRHTRGGRIHPDAFPRVINRQKGIGPEVTLTESTFGSQRHEQPTQSLPANTYRPLPDLPADINNTSTFDVSDSQSLIPSDSSHTERDPEGGAGEGTGANPIYAEILPRPQRGAAQMEQSIEVTAPDVPATAPPKPPRTLQPQEATQPQEAAVGRPPGTKPRPKSESLL